MKCQTSPDYPSLRYKDPTKRLAIHFGGDGGFLYHLSSTLVFWKDDFQCCQALDMALIGNNKLDVMGSYAIIWPVFLALCFSTFVEVLACAIQGRHRMPEFGMTLFEHSLSFAECENMISTALGLDFFGSPRLTTSSTKSSEETSSSAGPLLTKSMLLRRLNAPPEVLLICFISCLSHLSSAGLAVIGKRDQYRLVNTGIWAACYMSAFIWSFVNLASTSLDDADELGILRFPTVCIIGFIPHILILCGIFICATVYCIALLITAISLPPGLAANPSIKDRFRLAFQNLQANVQFASNSPIKLNWSEDFYTALLKLGFNVLTAASEAVYLNEGNRIHVHHMTWLEEKRLDELAAKVESRRQLDNIPLELIGERVAGLDYTDIGNPHLRSGFAQERKSKPGVKSKKTIDYDDGLGIAERRGRWQLTYEFAKGINLLLMRSAARLVIGLLTTLGVTRVPQWLGHAANFRDNHVMNTNPSIQRAQTPEFWLVSEDGILSIPDNADVDMEMEMRRRLRPASGTDPTDEAVDDGLYAWWKEGGWWGDVDKSGEYIARESDEDATSMVSMSTTSGNMSEEESGQRTPTQEDFPDFTRDSTPEHPFGLSNLARLLDPKSPQDREEAQMLSRHLQSERPMTRSQYRRRITRERARLLSGSADEQVAAISGIKTEEEEETALEHFILERRAVIGNNDAARGGSWHSGAEGMGSNGPQCVVCQSNPRVIMVWPCGCLSICDDCRVGVAARNFNNCLTCRTEVTAYSRLYVP